MGGNNLQATEEDMNNKVIVVEGRFLWLSLSPATL